MSQGTPWISPTLLSERTIRILSIVTVVCGGLSIVLGIVSLNIGVGTSVGATALLAGPFLLVAGLFGIVSMHSKTRCAVLTFFILSVIACCMCMVLAVACAVFLRKEVDDDTTSKGAKVAVDTLLILAALTALVTTLWACALCAIALNMVCGKQMDSDEMTANKGFDNPGSTTVDNVEQSNPKGQKTDENILVTS
ncbi:unnamed protein product [Owenia fusiformis]|uniref:Transmembrane protein n=1 Tax=Owenia fusiformis TaxID=6347 RepID=A0A8S4NSC6_OWEFU|nr:unnamed protein product [Owenia fusiformis]